MLWHAVIFGPEDTPWEGGTFKLNLTFSEDYPNKAPVVKFESKMFHPNIYNDGGICLDILQNQWSPIYGGAVLTSIQILLAATPTGSVAGQLGSARGCTASASAVQQNAGGGREKLDGGALARRREGRRREGRRRDDPPAKNPPERRRGWIEARRDTRR